MPEDAGHEGIGDALGQPGHLQLTLVVDIRSLQPEVPDPLLVIEYVACITAVKKEAAVR